MMLFAVVIVALVVVAGGLLVTMLRKDEPMLGLYALAVELVAGVGAVVYGGMNSG